MTSPSQHGARATNIDELSVIMSKLFTKESRHRGIAFQPHPSDIIISPYAKCGTTWLQQIAHGLRTHGSMDFDEITSVTPWLEVAYDLGWDIEAPQVALPRVYKSHLSWHDIPKGGRYICAFRNPKDAFVSFYRFFENYFFEPESISLEALFHWRWPRDNVAEKGYWQHLRSWWEQRDNDAVLLLCYEDMKADLPNTIKAIAHFMGVALDDDLFEIVLRQSSREFMLANKEQFSELPFRQHAYNLGVLPLEGEGHKITAGTPEKYQLPPELEHTLDEIWEEQIYTTLGIKDYATLRNELTQSRAG